MKLKDTIKAYLGTLPRKAGDPESFVSEMPMEIPVIAKGDPSIKLEEYDSILEADASLLPEDRVEGQAWRLIVRGRECKVKRRSRRYGKGPVVAEMRAMVDGMKEAAQRGACRLIVKTDSRWCAHVLVSLWTPGKDYTKPVAKPAKDLMKHFTTVAVVHTRTKNIRRIDCAARRAAEERRTDVDMKDSERLERLEKVIQRAKSVHLERVKDGWRANGRFHVTVYPPSCTCQQWSLRWRNVPLAGKRAQRIPCKHIAAAALDKDIQSLEALLALSCMARS